jgi:CheY-like chemotaxis protein
MTMSVRPLVLLVEDEPDIREGVGEILADDGYEVWSAESADAALHRLQCESRAPDVVLIDFFMPGLSTPEFLAHLRQHPAWAGTRIILMTAASESQIPADAPRNAVVRKPFDVAKMLETVRTCLSP